jgi:hypothetical protein
MLLRFEFDAMISPEFCPMFWLAKPPKRDKIPGG